MLGNWNREKIDDYITDIFMKFFYPIDDYSYIIL